MDMEFFIWKTEQHFKNRCTFDRHVHFFFQRIGPHAVQKSTLKKY